MGLSLLLSLAGSLPARAISPRLSLKNRCLNALQGLLQPKTLPDEDRVRALALLAGGANPSLLAPQVLKTLRAEFGDESLRDTARLAQALADAEARMDPERFAHILGEQARGLREALVRRDLEPWRTRSDETRDLNSQWGWMILPPNDPAFRDPDYLAQLLRQSGPVGTGFVKYDPNRVLEAFLAEWSRIAPPNTLPQIFTTTGSDANGLVYEAARRHVFRSWFGKRPDRVQVLRIAVQYCDRRG